MTTVMSGARSRVPDVAPPGGMGPGKDTTARVNSLVREELQRIPTLFGRLNYIAGLSAPPNGSVPLRAITRSHDDDVCRAIRQIHYELLYQWLDVPWACRVADAAAYFRALGVAGRSLATAGSGGDCQRLVPANAPEPHAVHFATDVALLLPLVSQRL
jgi:hypothetical protein